MFFKKVFLIQFSIGNLQKRNNFDVIFIQIWCLKKFFKSFFDPVFHREFAKILIFWTTFCLEAKMKKKWIPYWKLMKQVHFWKQNRIRKKWKIIEFPIVILILCFIFWSRKNGGKMKNNWIPYCNLDFIFHFFIFGRFFWLLGKIFFGALPDWPGSTGGGERILHTCLGSQARKPSEEAK